MTFHGFFKKSAHLLSSSWSKAPPLPVFSCNDFVAPSAPFPPIGADIRIFAFFPFLSGQTNVYSSPCPPLLRFCFTSAPFFPPDVIQTFFFLHLENIAIVIFPQQKLRSPPPQDWILPFPSLCNASNSVSDSPSLSPLNFKKHSPLVP